MSRGGSCIIDPLGKVLAGPLFDSSGILSAKLDLNEIVRGKFDFDVVGHYARPDVFRLAVNTSPAKPVVCAQPQEQNGVGVLQHGVNRSEHERIRG
jgi:nitrilase